MFSLADSHLCSDIRNPLNDDNNDGLGLECLSFVCYICFFYATKNDKSTLSRVAQFEH